MVIPSLQPALKKTPVKRSMKAKSQMRVAAGAVTAAMAAVNHVISEIVEAAAAAAAGAHTIQAEHLRAAVLGDDDLATALRDWFGADGKNHTASAPVPTPGTNTVSLELSGDARARLTGTRMELLEDITLYAAEVSRKDRRVTIQAGDVVAAVRLFLKGGLRERTLHNVREALKGK
ncbi:hypothetical protein [Streptomyces telluris]|uniref:Uncharacterized protein n=1 Tax=Streptomyces telluris TaxID=2720021 RepID=A0A9X2RSM5_9ACTN|nr:hypothetical protein [Streptomyces telluris]MCQ8774811.1 hypothetical protein [Streptomyces telluris]